MYTKLIFGAWCHEESSYILALLSRSFRRL